MSPETIGRHERGEVELTPDTVIQYADGYQRPDLMMRYCQECPVGRRIRPTISDKELPHVMMQLLNRAPKMAPKIARLGEITDDLVIDEHEEGDFHDIMEFLRDLDRTIMEFQLCCMNHGMGKGRPDESEAAPSNKQLQYINHGGDCQ